MSVTKIQKIIMRRVYLSYGLSLVANTAFWQGIFLGVSAILLAHWLHVASIIHNFLSVPVGGVPRYLVGSFQGAIQHGELLTVLVLVLAIIMSIQIIYRLLQARSVNYFNQQILVKLS